MSTRSTTHFTYGDENKPAAIVYRHSDGYPDGAGVDIRKFFRECQKLDDSRLNDAQYLAAKYVVFLADMFNEKMEYKDGKWKTVKPESRLEFLSVGVCLCDPGDIEYRYVVNCGKIGPDGLPELKCYEVDDEKTGKEVKVPALDETAA